MKADIRSYFYGWDCHLEIFAYPGFECDSLFAVAFFGDSTMPGDNLWAQSCGEATKQKGIESMRRNNWVCVGVDQKVLYMGWPLGKTAKR